MSEGHVRSDEQMHEERMHEERMHEERMHEEQMADDRMRDDRMDDRMRDDRMDDQAARQVEMRTTPGRNPGADDLTQPPAAQHGTPPWAGEPGPRTQAGDGLPVDAYRARLADAQAHFIDDPKGAVAEARSVLEEAVDRFMGSVRSELDSADDTERMRRAMQRCRDVLERLTAAPR